MDPSPCMSFGPWLTWLSAKFYHSSFEHLKEECFCLKQPIVKLSSALHVFCIQKKPSSAELEVYCAVDSYEK